MLQQQENLYLGKQKSLLQTKVHVRIASLTSISSRHGLFMEKVLITHYLLKINEFSWIFFKRMSSIIGKKLVQGMKSVGACTHCASHTLQGGQPFWKVGQILRKFSKSEPKLLRKIIPRFSRLTRKYVCDC